MRILSINMDTFIISIGLCITQIKFRQDINSEQLKIVLGTIYTIFICAKNAQIFSIPTSTVKKQNRVQTHGQLSSSQHLPPKMFLKFMDIKFGNRYLYTGNIGGSTH